jgi:hypothetical protein
MRTVVLAAIGAGVVILMTDFVAGTSARAKKSAVEPQSSPRLNEPRAGRLVVPKGTSLSVRLNQPLSTKANRPGDRFTATLNSPVVVGGITVFDAGTEVGGVIRQAAEPGVEKGRAVLTVALKDIRTTAGTFELATTVNTRVSGKHPKSSLEVPAEALMTFRLIDPIRTRG